MLKQILPIFWYRKFRLDVNFMGCTCIVTFLPSLKFGIVFFVPVIYNVNLSNWFNSSAALHYILQELFSHATKWNMERSGSVVECLPRDRMAAGSSLTGVTALCPWARHINPRLVVVQPRKTHPYITERLLMGRQWSNQINKLNESWCAYVGKSDICINAMASKLMQSADCAEIILFSCKLSCLCVKSDFVHKFIDQLSLNILRETSLSQYCIWVITNSL